MDLKELNEKVDAIAYLRTIRDERKRDIDDKRLAFEASIAADVDNLADIQNDLEGEQREVLEALRESGAKSVNTDAVSVARKTSVKYQVADKAEVMAWLEARGIKEDYVTEELNDRAKTLFKTAEVPGVEKVETEYLSVTVKAP